MLCLHVSQPLEEYKHNPFIWKFGDGLAHSPQQCMQVAAPCDPDVQNLCNLVKCNPVQVPETTHGCLGCKWHPLITINTRSHTSWGHCSSLCILVPGALPIHGTDQEEGRICNVKDGDHCWEELLLAEHHSMCVCTGKAWTHSAWPHKHSSLIQVKQRHICIPCRSEILPEIDDQIMLGIQQPTLPHFVKVVELARDTLAILQQLVVTNIGTIVVCLWGMPSDGIL